MEKLIIENSIMINANISKVWDALLNPAQTKKYMFGCETVSDWKVGSSLDWKALYEGKEMIFVVGKILDFKPETYLAYSVFDPNSSLENIPENHLTVTYQLTEEKGQTILTVTQGDYNAVAEGERRYKESYNSGEGWNPILVQIKKILEEN
jgi:uncharacterized protein YndB with AHSA1/START domain